MNKYIVKNCPAYDCSITEWNCLGSDATECKNGNCIMKQIVELCKFQQQEFDEEIKNGNYPDKYKFFKSGRADAGTEILQLLDIEECE